MRYLVPVWQWPSKYGPKWIHAIKSRRDTTIRRSVPRSTIHLKLLPLNARTARVNYRIVGCHVCSNAAIRLFAQCNSVHRCLTLLICMYVPASRVCSLYQLPCVTLIDLSPRDCGNCSWNTDLQYAQCNYFVKSIAILTILKK